ncbi:hypothetical protein [Microbacterium gorillae]|uniref:hypothetical protein n=1 Tax=Microbacterium gorillae TaxID=1231063 RepID=UPI00058C9723|nr:hypothetical protein [Microbacterium gorillae]
MQTQPPPGAAATELAFRQSQTKKVLSTLIIIAVLGLLAFMFLPRFLPNTMNHATRYTIAGLATAVVAALMIVTTLWLGNTRVVVTPTHVEVRRPGKTIHSWPRETTAFNTHVLKQTTNGIPSGTTRSLVAHTPAGTTKVAFSTMSRNTFNEMFAAVSTPVGVAPGAAGAAPAARPQALVGFPRVFETKPPVLRRRASVLIVLGVIALVVAVALIYLGITDESMAFSEFVVYGTVVLMVALVLVVIGTVGFVQDAARPKRIEVGAAGVNIDGTTYPYAGLSRIWVTPDTYQRRRLKLVGPTGVAKTYSLGVATTNPDKAVLGDWVNLVGSLQQATAATPGLVAFDLE